MVTKKDALGLPDDFDTNYCLILRALYVFLLAVSPGTWLPSPLADKLLVPTITQL